MENYKLLILLTISFAITVNGGFFHGLVHFVEEEFELVKDQVIDDINFVKEIKKVFTGEETAGEYEQHAEDLIAKNFKRTVELLPTVKIGEAIAGKHLFPSVSEIKKSDNRFYRNVAWENWMPFSYSSGCHTSDTCSLCIVVLEEHSKFYKFKKKVYLIIIFFYSLLSNSISFKSYNV